MSKVKQKLSMADRLHLVQTLNALPTTQFDELCFALAPPKGIVPLTAVSQGDRSRALLDWIESPTGPGLMAIDEMLQVFVPKAIQPEQAIPETLSGKRFEWHMAANHSFGRFGPICN